MVTSPSSVVVLGIDPGSRATGIAIIDVKGRQNKLVFATVLRVQGLVSERLYRLGSGLEEIIARYAPTEMAIEKVFVARNPQSALKLGQARGVLICSASKASIPVYEYAATKVKSAVVGHGHAGKQEIQKMIQLEYRLEKELPQDATDAVAIATAHAVLRINPYAREEALV